MQFAAAAPSDQTNRHRWLVFTALLLGEIILTSYAFNFPTGLPEWFNPVTQAKVAAQAALLALVILLVIAWPARTTIFQVWSHASRSHNWRTSIGVNLALFATLLAATVAFSNLAAHASEPPWHWFALYCLLLLVTATSLAVVAAPLTFWRWLVREMPSQVAIAALSGALLVLAGRLSLEGWSSLASATLRASHWILTLYETNVVLDVDRLILGVGDFQVLVLKECSGYEGIGLVTAFLVFYCWLMRHKLRFPHALLLLPVGIVIAWSLNALRIALLISIGRHASPDIALNGFHSQAGWIGFLALAISIMAVSGKISFFRAEPKRAAPIAKPGNDLLLALLAPFMALMATSIIASLFAPHDEWLYFLKVAAVGGTLWLFRSAYGSLPTAVSPLSIAVGIGIGIVWVMTDPRGESGETLAIWFASLPTWLVVLWLSCRGLGSVVVVPMAEELAFRGYLQRILVSRDFSQVAPGQFTWLSFVVTSLLFGMMHQRWVAAALAGALYALLVYRTNRLSDAIAAHAASNLVIFICAVAARQWSLL
jgi:exosortase E/protease (VPEID-CTERM system)